LVDEYDAPVLNAIQEPKSIKNKRFIDQTRKVMRGFYTIIKAADAFTDFVFLTGISKFSRMGVFSSLNNINDISLDPEYAALMGYTQKELLDNFTPFVEKVAKKFGEKPEKMTERIADHYNGFSFDGETFVYNPFSTLGFFFKEKFKNFWVESGSTSFIREFFKDKKLTIEQFKDLPVSEDFVSAPGEIEKTSPEGFLYQSGYLSLRKRSDPGYVLDYPNFEVLSALSAFFLENIIGNEATLAMFNVVKHFRERNATGLVKEFKRMFSAITYSDCYQTEKHKFGESFYRPILQTFLHGAGISTRPEEHNNMGRADLVAAYNDQVIIFELKMAKNAASSKSAATKGMEQMRLRKYGNCYENPLLLSLAIDEKQRNIGAWIAENFDSQQLDEVEETKSGPCL
jgi:hypothetical protein